MSLARIKHNELKYVIELTYTLNPQAGCFAITTTGKRGSQPILNTMKKMKWITMLLVFSTGLVSAQNAPCTSLVIDGDFELDINGGLGRIPLSNSWNTIFLGNGGSPDLFNANGAQGFGGNCNNQCFDTDQPNLQFGSLAPIDGDGYAGFAISTNQNTNPLFEYLFAGLSTPLDPGNTYQLTFQIANSNCRSDAVNNMGVVFFNAANPIPTAAGGNQILVNSDFTFSDMNQNVGQWTLIQYNFTASGNEDVIGFGAFSEATFVNVPGPGNGGQNRIRAYYNIDDVDLQKIGNPISIVNSDNMICPGEAVTISVCGNNTFDEYVWYYNGNEIVGEDACEITVSEPGSYYAVMKEGTSCQTSKSVLILEQPTFDMAVTSITPTSCDEDCTGSAEVEVTGAQGIITYVLNGANTGELDPNPHLFENLCGGEQTITIVDDSGCEQEMQFDINDNSASFTLSHDVLEVNCEQENSGAINLHVSNVEEPYSVLWDNGATTPNINILTAGTYSVVVTDANGCTQEDEFTLEAPEDCCNACELITVDTEFDCSTNELSLIDASGSVITQDLSCLAEDDYVTSGDFQYNGGNSNLFLNMESGATVNIPMDLTQGADTDNHVESAVVNGNVLTLNMTGTLPDINVTLPSGGASSSDADWFQSGGTAVPVNINNEIYTNNGIGINVGANTSSQPMNPAAILHARTNVPLGKYNVIFDNGTMTASSELPNVGETRFMFLGTHRGAVRGGHHSGLGDLTIGGASAAFGGSNNVASVYGFSAGNDNVLESSATSSVAFGASNKILAGYSGAIGLHNQISKEAYGSNAFGERNEVKASSSIAGGNANVVNGTSSIALGNRCEANGWTSVALGYKSLATGNYSFASGNTSEATEMNAVAIGTNNKSNGVGSVSLGASNTSTGSSAVTIGQGNTLNGSVSYALGNGNSSVSSHAYMIGYQNLMVASAPYSVLVGTNNSSSATSGMVFGKSSHATGTQSMVLGWSSTSSAQDAIAIGYGVNNTVPTSVLIGINSENTLSVQSQKIGVMNNDPQNTLDIASSSGSGVRLRGLAGQNADGCQFLTVDANGDVVLASAAACGGSGKKGISENSNDELLDYIKKMEERILALEEKLLQQAVAQSDEEQQVNPLGNSLAQNAPNPFADVTTIKYTVSRDGYIELRVLDVTGKVLDCLQCSYQAAGSYSVDWHRGNLTTGTYYYSLYQEGVELVKKAMIIE